jgi:hypothetical protein
MTDLKQEARTLTLGERIVLIAQLAVMEHVRQSVSSVPQDLVGYDPNESFESSFAPEDDSLAPLIFPTPQLVGLP